MPFFDKDKTIVTLLLEKNAVMPGETVMGTMSVVVIERVRCTALRVCIHGQETMYRRKEVPRQSNQVGRYGVGRNQFNGIETQIETSTHHIVERVATVLGEQSGCGARGSVELEPGNYDYPFSIVMPTDVPPTYCVKEYKYGGDITYTVKAVVDIPMGFDNEVRAALTVHKMVPLSQVYAARATPLAVNAVRSDIAKYGCRGCFCGYEEDSYLLTTAIITPHVAVVDHNAAGLFPPSIALMPPLKEQQQRGLGEGPESAPPPPISVSGDPSVITVRVMVVNHTKSTALTSARVKLRQYVTYRGGCEHTIHLADQVIAFQEGVLQPGQSTAFDCSLPVGEGGCTSDYALPTFVSHFARVWTVLGVEYPNVKADNTLHAANVIKLVSGIDATNLAIPA
ncbi:hypothetical protein ABL78_7757 [Leptomonas seymouri]|uniref:Arrestin-like N-terminal domain-containing protein n=1 Tax=Leptomonas seymouri TaxID=5684 RepID=A0A0N1HTK3_LEPSE|nr:hypothetical protein ABL78_7757 [Leptomonas seymouri]|eukprot:KPI83218.1 hypothetical protein ABL78_7757 [Leptomonas seymouri]